ncbi:TPA: YggT family protein, partial [Mannheimia haemolytica]|nr:YggT family protein [Mannheimia haemolytica]
MEFLAPVISLIVGFLSFVLVLRTWLQFCRVDPRLPISQTLLKITEPMVSPVGKLIPTVKNICFPALLIAAALVTLQFILFGVDLPRAVLIG